MKLKIMIMALLILAGIGSAGRLPATEFVGDVDMAGNNIEMGNGSINNATTVYSIVPKCYIYELDDTVYVRNDTGYVIYSDTGMRAAIQAANDHLYAIYGGGIIVLPAGSVLIDDASVFLDKHITIEGARVPGKTGWQSDFDNTSRQNTIIEITYSGGEAFNLSSGGENNIRKLIFYYPDQVINSSTPVFYPATITCGDNMMDVIIEDCVAMNPYYFINHTGDPHNSLIVRHTQGFPIRCGILEDNSFGGSEYENVDFNPNFGFGDTPGTLLRAYIKENGVGFDIRQSDNVWISNCEVFGYGHPFELTGTAGARIHGSIADTGKFGFNLTNAVRCNLVDCTGWGGMQHQLYVSGGYGNQITLGEFSSIVNVIYINSPHTTFSENNVTGGAGTTIAIYSYTASDNVWYQGNYITGTGSDYGIQSWGDNVGIHNNIIKGFEQTIELNWASNNTIGGNILTSSINGIRLSNMNGVSIYGNHVTASVNAYSATSSSSITAAANMPAYA